LTVPSTVADDVIPYFTESPASGLSSAGANESGVACTCCQEYVALGPTSSVSGRLRSCSTIVAWRSMKPLPAGTSGHEAEMPSRLTRRQNSTPMLTSVPLLKRTLVRGSRSSTS
jgi:hypothetical protein